MISVTNWVGDVEYRCESCGWSSPCKHNVQNHESACRRRRDHVKALQAERKAEEQLFRSYCAAKEAG